MLVKHIATNSFIVSSEWSDNFFQVLHWIKHLNSSQNVFHISVSRSLCVSAMVRTQLSITHFPYFFSTPDFMFHTFVYVGTMVCVSYIVDEGCETGSELCSTQLFSSSSVRKTERFSDSPTNAMFGINSWGKTDTKLSCWYASEQQWWKNLCSDNQCKIEEKKELCIEIFFLRYIFFSLCSSTTQHWLLLSLPAFKLNNMRRSKCVWVQCFLIKKKDFFFVC